MKWATLLAGCVVCGLQAADTSRVIADFDGADPLAGWILAGDRGFANSASSLGTGPGHAGQGAIVTYRFPCTAERCGGSVAAIWTPAQPISVKHRAAVSLWIRALPEVQLALLVRDKNEGLRRYPIEAVTLEHPGGEWRQVVIPLAAKSTGYWDEDHNGAPEGRVVSISFEVASRYPQALSGAVAFDDVCLLDSPDQTFEFGPDMPVVPPPAGSATLASRLGVNVHRLQDPNLAAMVHGAGFAFIRADFLWRQVERNGRYRFFLYDRLLASLESQGLDALWILDYGHPQHGGDVPRSAADIAAFVAFAEATAARFKGHHVRYEIWNEPDTDRFWPPHPNAREYAALLRESAAAIRRADPGALVALGGVSKIDLPFLEAVAAAGGMAGINAAAVHPYRRQAPETLAAEMPLIRDFLGSAAGESAEIWDTEWGYASYDYFSQNLRGDGHSAPGRYRQAVLGSRELLTVWALGLPVAVWYDLEDDGDDPKNPEYNHGLFDSKGVEKPVIKAFHVLMAAARYRSFSGMARDVPDGVHAMRLDGDGGREWVIWNDQPDARITLRLPKNASVRNLMGEPVKLKSGQMELTEVEGPVYVALNPYSSQKSRG